MPKSATKHAPQSPSADDSAAPLRLPPSKARLAVIALACLLILALSALNHRLDRRPSAPSKDDDYHPQLILEQGQHYRYHPNGALQSLAQFQRLEHRARPYGETLWHVRLHHYSTNGSEHRIESQRAHLDSSQNQWHLSGNVHYHQHNPQGEHLDMQSQQFDYNTQAQIIETRYPITVTQNNKTIRAQAARLYLDEGHFTFYRQTHSRIIPEPKQP